MADVNYESEYFEIMTKILKLTYYERDRDLSEM